MNLEQLRALLEAGDHLGALKAFDVLVPAERGQAAALALHLGRPKLAARWAQGQDPLLQVAALLRLGEREAALGVLSGQPETARTAVLRARAIGSLESAEAARALARREGDSPALIAAATLMGERLLFHDPHAALRALAEGLKVSEMMRVDTDAHLLAVLSLVQRRVGGEGKALRTAAKALERSQPHSPARVLALLALGHTTEAEAERAAGDLDLDFQPFLASVPE